MNEVKRLVKFNLNNTVDLPVFTQNASAGIGGGLFDDSYEMQSVPNCLVDNPQNTQVWQVGGDSMFPTLKPKDRILVERQNTAEKGDIVIAYYDGTLYIKKFHVTDNGELWLLSDNPSYEPMFISSHLPFAIIGVAVGFYRGFK